MQPLVTEGVSGAGARTGSTDPWWLQAGLDQVVTGAGSFLDKTNIRMAVKPAGRSRCGQRILRVKNRAARQVGDGSRSYDTRKADVSSRNTGQKPTIGLPVLRGPRNTGGHGVHLRVAGK